MADIYHSPGTGKKAGPTGYPDGMPEHLHTDIESTIHQHMGHDGQSDEALDWVTGLMSALEPLIVRALDDALGTQTTDEVLWEGRSVPASTTCDDGSVVQPGCLDCPPGTRVRVVRAADRCPECGGEGARGCGAAWHDPHRATDQPSGDRQWLCLRCSFCGHWDRGQFTKADVADWLRTHRNGTIGQNEGHTVVASTCPHPCGTPMADQPTEVADIDGSVGRDPSVVLYGEEGFNLGTPILPREVSGDGQP